MIRIITSGLYTTLQDGGRFGYRSQGVPLSGPMDRRSAALANRLLGNDENATLLEFTATGPTLLFEQAARISITGGIFEPQVNGSDVPMNRVLAIAPGSQLTFSRPLKGWRGYIGIAGGFKSEMVLGSTSFYRGITSQLKLEKGGQLQFDPTAKVRLPDQQSETAIATHLDSHILEAYKGPEFQQLPQSVQQKLTSLPFTTHASSNRMAYVFDTSEMIRADGIITAPVQPGTVQLTPSGRLHLLMRDAQTTGGYARVLQLTENSMDILAQKRPGTEVSIKIVDPPFDIRV